MSQAPQNNCVCSSCFKRNYELFNYQSRSSFSGKKRGSVNARPIRPPTAEEMEIYFWKSYLQKQKDERRKRVVTAPAIRKPLIKEEVEEICYEIRSSKVFLESPTTADDRQQIMDVDLENFWDFVYGQTWKGRIRVCEGELMHKLTETLKTLVNKKKIGNFTLTRMFTARSNDNESDSVQTKERQSSKIVVRLDQTYYGGLPRKPSKMVRFNLVPNSVFSPRLISVSPILKRDKNPSREVTHQKFSYVSPAVQPPLTSGIGRHEPTLSQYVYSGESQEGMRIFTSCVNKDEFWSMCLKATEDFIVTKEMITNSKTLKSSTFFTLRRKENLSGTIEIAETMKDFYTSANLSEPSEDSRELTPLLEMD